MKPSHIMCIPKTLTDLCFTKQRIKTKSTFARVVYSILVENAVYEFIKGVLKEYQYCKKVLKKDFNKNLILTEKEEQFQSSNTSWICKKLIDDDDEKVKYHCHITGKFRGIAHWSCNINIQLTKKVSVNISQFKRL